MQRLANQGMISIQHGERARIVEVDMDSMIGQIDLAARHLLSSSAENVDHLREARLFFETGLVKLAAQRASAEDIERLTEAFHLMRKNLDSEHFVPADMAFHNEIARISGNPIYVAVSRAILHWMADYRRDLLSYKTQRMTLDEHEKILERISAHDAAGAENMMHDHLTRRNNDLARSKKSGRR
jgi:DNA-binding FadR family transcriptional regulator